RAAHYDAQVNLRVHAEVPQQPVQMAIVSPRSGDDSNLSLHWPPIVEHRRWMRPGRTVSFHTCLPCGPRCAFGPSYFATRKFNFRDDSLPFLNCYPLPSHDAGELVDLPAWPLDLEIGDHRLLAKAKRKHQLALGEIARPAPHHLPLLFVSIVHT